MNIKLSLSLLTILILCGTVQQIKGSLTYKISREDLKDIKKSSAVGAILATTVNAGITLAERCNLLYVQDGGSIALLNGLALPFVASAAARHLTHDAGKKRQSSLIAMSSFTVATAATAALCYPLDKGAPFAAAFLPACATLGTAGFYYFKQAKKTT